MLALLGSHDEPTTRSLDHLDPDPELETHAMPLMQSAREVADDRRHRAAHEPRRQLEDRDAGAELCRRGCDLQADEAAADQDDGAAGPEFRTDALGILQAPQVMDRQVIEGGEPPRAATRGDQELVVSDVRPVGQIHVLRHAIDPAGWRAQLERDALLPVKAFGLQQKRRGREPVGEIGLGERRPLIRWMRLVANERDLGIGCVLAQHFRRAKAGGPGADDDELQRHAANDRLRRRTHDLAAIAPLIADAHTRIRS